MPGWKGLPVQDTPAVIRDGRVPPGGHRWKCLLPARMPVDQWTVSGGKGPRASHSPLPPAWKTHRVVTASPSSLRHQLQDHFAFCLPVCDFSPAPAFHLHSQWETTFREAVYHLRLWCWWVSISREWGLSSSSGKISLPLGSDWLPGASIWSSGGACLQCLRPHGSVRCDTVGGSCSRRGLVTHLWSCIEFPALTSARPGSGYRGK